LRTCAWAVLKLPSSLPLPPKQLELQACITCTLFKGVILIKVKYVHVWKSDNETFTVQLIYANKAKQSKTKHPTNQIKELTSSSNSSLLI
jgi:hypothetical protein